MPELWHAKPRQLLRNGLPLLRELSTFIYLAGFNHAARCNEAKQYANKSIRGVVMAYTMSEAALKARRKGAKARGKQLAADRAHQQAAGRVRGNSTTDAERTALGRAGFKATIEKYGADRIVEIVRARQLARPSSLEVKAVKLLDDLSIPYEQQARCFEDKCILIDFYLPRHGVYLDVNGYYHSHNARTIKRDEYVVARMEREGRRYLQLWDYEVNDWEKIVRANLGIST